MHKVYARQEGGKVAVFNDAAGTRRCGAFPFDGVDRLRLQPHVTREVEAHGVIWSIDWMPAL